MTDFLLDCLPLSCVAPTSSDARIREYGSLRSHIVSRNDGKLFRKLLLEPIRSHAEKVILVVSVIIFIEEAYGEILEH